MSTNNQHSGQVVLEVNDLRTYFYTRDGVVRSVDGMSFAVCQGETLAIVGESGCGKSVTSLSILRLIASPPGKIVSGSIKFHGKDLLNLSDDEMREIRGDKISMIFQEPMTSLNPVLTVGQQIGEVLELHRGCSREQARSRTLEMLKLVNIPEPENRIDNYPHQLSGGMRQRIMIAMALACDPEILIADEPTTALDVTVQSQILQLIREMQKEFNMALILITHDLGVVAEVADRVNVMYAGKIVESGSAEDIYYRPDHPYSIGLLNSIPKIGELESKRLVAIPGQPPSLINLPKGCSFRARCSFTDRVAGNLCATTAPTLENKTTEHFSRCHLTEAELVKARTEIGGR